MKYVQKTLCLNFQIFIFFYLGGKGKGGKGKGGKGKGGKGKGGKGKGGDGIDLGSLILPAAVAGAGGQAAAAAATGLIAALTALFANGLPDPIALAGALLTAITAASGIDNLITALQGLAAGIVG